MDTKESKNLDSHLGHWAGSAMHERYAVYRKFICFILVTYLENQCDVVCENLEHIYQ